MEDTVQCWKIEEKSPVVSHLDTTKWPELPDLASRAKNKQKSQKSPESLENSLETNGVNKVDLNNISSLGTSEMAKRAGAREKKSCWN